MKHSKNLMVISCCLLLLVLGLFTSCKRDSYYKDGGLAQAKFDGTVLQYLASKPVEFDSLVQIIKLAGLEDTFNKEEITFFAPGDGSIKKLIGQVNRGGINNRLFYEGRDTIKVLSDVNGQIWKKYLQRYIFRGKNKLMDYPQIDFNQQVIYPGQIYYAANNTVSNIGVVYNDAGGVRYVGYRQLHISYIPDISRPSEGWRTVRIASSDIQPNNGVVHVLVVDGQQFGFDQGEVENEISDSKR